MKKFLILFVIVSSSVFTQNITWQEITSQYQLPAGVKVFKGLRISPKLQAFYIDVDLNNKNLAIRPYIASAANLKTFTKNVGAYAAINGGFFGGGISLSAVVYPNELKSQNVSSLIRNSKSYPVLRSFFSMKKDGSLSVDWIYHFGSTIKDIYKFDQPMSYIENDPNPKPAPQKSEGKQYDDLLLGIGGAPRLVKNGNLNITYNEEIMWGSGVGHTNNDPRTAVGFTANKHVILFVADGRQPSISEGISLTELAQVLINLGCIEAMNLDGGGSTQMAVPNTYINSPSEERAVPTILAVVHADSLNIPKVPVFEKIIDTGDPNAVQHGTGWFATANSGYYGTTPSLLCIKGDGTNYYEFKSILKGFALYEVYGWWVASSNRCSDTPFIINHANGIDTVKVNQQIDGSSWKLIGKYFFGKSENENVIISNAAKNGTYVVADAVRFVSYDSSSVVSVEKDFQLPDVFALFQNFPNPFNPSTTIKYSIPSVMVRQAHHNNADVIPSLSRDDIHVTLKVYDILGREVAILVNEFQKPGTYNYQFSIGNYQLSSGVYFYQLKAGNFIQSKKMIVMK